MATGGTGDGLERAISWRPKRKRPVPRSVVSTSDTMLHGAYGPFTTRIAVTTNCWRQASMFWRAPP